MNTVRGPVRTTIKIRDGGIIAPASVAPPQLKNVPPEMGELSATRRARFLPRVALFAAAAAIGAGLTMAVFEGSVPSVKVTYIQKNEAISR